MILCKPFFQVSPYKKIRKVVFVDQIPRSPSGKILRRLVMALAFPQPPEVTSRLWLIQRRSKQKFHQVRDQYLIVMRFGILMLYCYKFPFFFLSLPIWINKPLLIYMYKERESMNESGYETLSQGSVCNKGWLNSLFDREKEFNAWKRWPNGRG